MEHLIIDWGSYFDNATHVHVHKNYSILIGLIVTYFLLPSYTRIQYLFAKTFYSKLYFFAFCWGIEALPYLSPDIQDYVPFCLNEAVLWKLSLMSSVAASITRTFCTWFSTNRTGRGLSCTIVFFWHVFGLLCSTICHVKPVIIFCNLHVYVLSVPIDLSSVPETVIAWRDRSTILHNTRLFLRLFQFVELFMSRPQYYIQLVHFF